MLCFEVHSITVIVSFTLLKKLASYLTGSQKHAGGPDTNKILPYPLDDVRLDQSIQVQESIWMVGNGLFWGISELHT